jgi:cellulose synthase/poly-beta-1,6-N-acetylglucosamine synthase-like glycosyltransferase
VTKWLPSLLLAYAQVGYLALLAAWARRRARRRSTSRRPPPAGDDALPTVSLIVAAHDEETVIAAKVANALALDYPRERLEVIVCCDGCTDATAERARQAGADLVLDLPRGGKVQSQDAGVARATGEITAFSDANATLDADALRELVAPFADPQVGYVCGRCASSTRPARTRRACTGATRWRCARSSRGCTA